MSYTTIEQSKKLLELGLNPESADMSWEKVSNDIKEEFSWEVFLGANPAIKMNTFSFRNGYVLPCWSTDALLQALPFECNLHSFNTECGKVYRLESFKYQMVKTYSTPIEAVFAIAVVYLENPEPQLYLGIEGYGFEQDLRCVYRGNRMANSKRPY